MKRIILCLSIFGCLIAGVNARDLGQWEAVDPGIRQWYQALMRTACSSSAILLGVAPSDSCGVWSPSASPENPRNCAAKDDAISPADAAASAGQKNAEYGN